MPRTILFHLDENCHRRGWFVPAEDRERVIVQLHGYGGDRWNMVPRTKFFRVWTGL